jgi:DNA-binding PadR family transcriptional regulator
MDKSLTPTIFGILLARASGERHGVGIIEEVGQRTNGNTTLSIGTLYRSIARMCDAGLIAPVSMALIGSRRPAPQLISDHDRGCQALAREVERLNRLVR